MRDFREFGILLFFVFAAGQGEVLLAQMGRATITGIVRDTSGAVVPSATVTADHVETRVSQSTTTNEVGNYTIANLPIGLYTVSYSAAGFKTNVQSGIDLVSGQIARIDVSLEVGQVSEEVTVRAKAAMLQTETAQASESVDHNVFSMLPLAFGTYGRNMTAFAETLVPGVVGRKYVMKAQGTAKVTQNVVIDGMTNLSFLPGDFDEDSISPEAIQEMTVFVGNQTAEYGRTGAASLNFILKSGTNDVHGSAFYYLDNEALNANAWANNLRLARDPNFTSSVTENFKRPASRAGNYGGSFGGPVYIPKIFDGRNRTFFHVTVERYNVNRRGPTVLQATAPQPEMLNGDFSRLLTGKRVGTDELGRPVMEGQIYDPATLRQVNGRLVADPFLGNIIPHSRFSSVAANNFIPIFRQYYLPATTDLNTNLYGTNRYQVDVSQFTLKADHSITSGHRLSGYIYVNGFPRRLQRGGGGIWSLGDPESGGPLSRYGYQHRKGHSWNGSYDWIISPILLNHLSFGRNETWNQNYNPRDGEQVREQLGIRIVPEGVPSGEVAPPAFTLAGSPVMHISGNWINPQNDRRRYRSYNLSDTITWQHSKHTLKFGFEWSYGSLAERNYDNSGGIFSYSSRTTAIPGYSYTSRLGDSFASFLLGQVDSASLGVGTARDSFRQSYAAFAHDTWKVTPRLTLNLGLRWNGDTAVTEREDRVANFSTTLIDPSVGLPGAVEYMGFGAGRAGRRTIGPGYYKSFGPSFGLAYRITEKLVLRGGYGISYTPETIATAHGWQAVAFSAGFQPTNVVPADSKGQYRPVFSIDSDYPGKTIQADLDPSWAQRTGAVRIHSDTYRPAYVQHFNFGFQFQLTGTTMVETEWRASKGTRFRAGGIVRLNQIRKEELKRGSVLGQIIDTPEKAAAADLPYPYPGFKGTGANTLMPFPQLGNKALSAWGDPVGFSNYHSGNLIITQRMTRGVTAYGAYTFSKSITNSGGTYGVLGAGTGIGVADTYNRTLYKMLDPDDRTHMIKAMLTWDLPFGKGKSILGSSNPALNAVVGGWNVAAIINYSSGTPLAAPNSLTKPVGWNGPSVVADFNTPASGFSRVFDPNTFNPWNRNDPGNRFFEPSAFSNASPQDLGSSPPTFPQVRRLWTWNEDVTIMKRFAITERVRLELRVSFFNAFNRHSFGAPDMNMNNKSFGNVITANGNRTGQAGLRLDW